MGGTADEPPNENGSLNDAADRPENDLALLMLDFGAPRAAPPPPLRPNDGGSNPEEAMPPKEGGPTAASAGAGGANENGSFAGSTPRIGDSRGDIFPTDTAVIDVSLESDRSRDTVASGTPLTVTGVDELAAPTPLPRTERSLSE